MVHPIEKELYFDRDENGNIIPCKFQIEVEGEKDDVLLTPLTRGQLKKIFSGIEEDYDNFIILNNVKSPKYTEKDIESLKTLFFVALINKVYEISGVKTKEKKDRKAEFEKVDDFGKKLAEVRERKKEGDVILFLHEQGYNFFNVNNLTIHEINWLVESFNFKQKKHPN